MQKLILLVVIACIATALAAPDSKDLKELKKEKQRVAACSKDCGNAYQPICAGDGKNKPLSFGSECVMKNYNCEHKSNLAKVSDGECPGGTGIRLS